MPGVRIKQVLNMGATYSLSLSSLLILLIAMLMPCSLALCPVDEPLDPDLANNNAYYIQICGLDPPNGVLCPSPLPPSIDFASQHAQGVRLTAWVPDVDGLSANAVWWQAGDVLAGAP